MVVEVGVMGTLRVLDNVVTPALQNEWGARRNVFSVNNLHETAFFFKIARTGLAPEPKKCSLQQCPGPWGIDEIIGPLIWSRYVRGQCFRKVVGSITRRLKNLERECYCITVVIHCLTERSNKP